MRKEVKNLFIRGFLLENLELVYLSTRARLVAITGEIGG
jgi:hypothetical protein